MSRPYRSVLYVPASNPRALEKARMLAADAFIFDLEDAVAPDEKPAARARLVEALRADWAGRARLVRINGLDTEWGSIDVRALAHEADGLVVPKVDTPEDLDAVRALAPMASLWAMMETAAGILNVAAIADHPALDGMIMGTNDLATEMDIRARPGRPGLLTALSLCLLAARAKRLIMVDGVCNAFRDRENLIAECEQGRDFGFDGKTLIHPSQIDAANRIFAPSEDEIILARRQIEVFDAALAEGRGVAVLDGLIVESLHAEAALRTLDRAAAIAAMTRRLAEG